MHRIDVRGAQSDRTLNGRLAIQQTSTPLELEHVLLGKFEFVAQHRNEMSMLRVHERFVERCDLEISTRQRELHVVDEVLEKEPVPVHLLQRTGAYAVH